MPLYHRLAHMKDTPVVSVGQWVRRGELVGYCGSTGNSTGPHCHYDILKMQPAAWTAYVYGWPKWKVIRWYLDPARYIRDGVPMTNAYPKSGWGYLQWARGYFHPGVDINGVNDLGKPVLSPVEGRVVYIQGTSWIRDKWGRLVKKNWGSGWGNMVVIEEKPGFTF